METGEVEKCNISDEYDLPDSDDQVHLLTSSPPADERTPMSSELWEAHLSVLTEEDERIPISSPDCPFTKRLLYTISEENEGGRSGHHGEMIQGPNNNRSVTVLSVTLSDDITPLPVSSQREQHGVGSSAALDPPHSITTKSELDTALCTTWADDVTPFSEKTLTPFSDITVTPGDHFSGSESEEEGRMLPSTWSEGFGRRYSSYCLRKKTKNSATQCDSPMESVASCSNCDLLTKELTRVSKMLKKAEAEIDFLNEEFKILSEDRGRNGKKCQKCLRYTDTEQVENRVYSVTKWLIWGILGFPRSVLRLFIFNEPTQPG